MRDGPSSEVLAGAARWWPTVSSWRGTDLLAESVPVTSGRLSVNGDQQVPERLTFTVPEWADGRSWVPEGFLDPLAHYGQYVDVDINVEAAVTGAVSTTRLGRFQIQSWAADDDGLVSVECVGLLQRVLDARFRVPQVPRPNGTLVSEFRRLMVPGMPVVIDAGLVDRPCPQNFVWDDDRLGALYELADAWPARLRVDQFGALRVLPPLPSTPVPVLSWADGEGGTVIRAPRSGSRDGVHNVVVARSSGTDQPGRPPLQAVAVTGEHALRPDVYGEVVRFWSSPLATTTSMLQASADTLVAGANRRARPQVVRMVPDSRVELDDAARVTRGGRTAVGWVTGYDMPLTVEDGDMAVEVGR